MANNRRRVIVFGLTALLLGWVLALGGYFLARETKVTAEKVATHLRSVDLEHLAGSARADALRSLARQMNALPHEERRRARLEGEWERWFSAMTEQEKGEFIEATMPSGFKQMLNSFEQLPPDKRQQAIERSMRGLQKARETMEKEGPEAQSNQGTNQSGELSPELQQKVVTIGLKTFYSESSAQTKAELAPLLEEMQKVMESGAMFRGGRR